MKSYATVATMLTLMAVLASPAEAQDKHTRRGFWAGFGAGGGWSSSPSFIVDDDRLRGGSAYLRMGGTVSPQFLVGGETIVWWREEGDFANGDGLTDIARVNVTVSALVYPGSELDLFVKAGFGVASVEEGPGIDAEGVGTTLGVGYDIRLGRNLYLTPNFDTMVHWLPDSTDWSLVFTMGLTWH